MPKMKDGFVDGKRTQVPADGADIIFTAGGLELSEEGLPSTAHWIDDDALCTDAEIEEYNDYARAFNARYAGPCKAEDLR